MLCGYCNPPAAAAASDAENGKTTVKTNKHVDDDGRRCEAARVNMRKPCSTLFLSAQPNLRAKQPKPALRMAGCRCSETYVRVLAGVAVVPEHVHVAARINARVEQARLQQRRGDARIGQDLQQRVAMLGGQRSLRVVVQVGVSAREQVRRKFVRTQTRRY